MAGKITISTLNNDTGVLATQNGMTGIPKAWGSFNGNGGATLNNSFNISSVTRNSTGAYTINFTTALANANYTVVASAGTLTNTTKIATPNTPLAGSFKIETLNTTWGTQDCYWATFAVFNT